MIDHKNLLKGVGSDFERYSYTRSRLMEECNLRRDRQWNVFSWTSGLLLAVMGGAISLLSTGNMLSVRHAALLAVAAVSFCSFSVVWIKHDSSVALFHSDACAALDQEFKLWANDKPMKRPHIGYIGFIILLGFTTIAVVALSAEYA